MTDAKVNEMIADACLAAGADAEMAADLRAFLERHALDPEDVEAILASPPRLALYRRLVRANFVGVVERMMPRTRARLNALAGDAFDRALDQFLDEVAPRTHYLRDVPQELLAWVAPRWADDARIPAYAVDLARHELLHFEVAAAPVPREPPKLDEVALGRPLVFAEAKRLARYAYAVHELPGELDDRSEPRVHEIALLVYRDPEHAVRYMELTPLAAAILERLFAGTALDAAVAPACASLGVTLTNDVLADTARLLADLGARGVLLGARAA